MATKTRRWAQISAWLFFTLSASAQAAKAQAPQTASPSIWWIPLVSAGIGAAAALATPLLKEIWLQRLIDSRSRSRQHQEIFRNYAAPLAASAEKLVWRFSEVFIDKRHHFLKSATLPFVFNEYKRKSTLYRIASLLGWIRAMRLELSALPRGEASFLVPISDAINKIQSALADGPHVEVHRLKQICLIWDIDITDLAVEKLNSLATEFEVKLYEAGGDSLKEDSNYLQNLPKDRQNAICGKLSDFLCQKLGRAKISENIIGEKVHQAISGLSYKEALIYRDWQDAIADTMLEPDKDSVRRYKIIGYEQFEKVLGGSSLWIEVFRDSIVDIDFDALDPNDFRAKQLKDLAASVADLVISMSNSDEKDLIPPILLTKAKQLKT